MDDNEDISDDGREKIDGLTLNWVASFYIDENK